MSFWVWTNDGLFWIWQWNFSLHKIAKWKIKSIISVKKKRGNNKGTPRKLKMSAWPRVSPAVAVGLCLDCGVVTTCLAKCQHGCHWDGRCNYNVFAMGPWGTPAWFLTANGFAVRNNALHANDLVLYYIFKLRRIWRVLTMVYNTQNYWVSGLWPSSEILTN
jgi:hypothetical protein